jgi:hypothetical protein
LKSIIIWGRKIERERGSQEREAQKKDAGRKEKKKRGLLLQLR